ncbi:class F sortase [Streptomyces sp. JJ36]|uniref:class F sortase n=1 Tax=Streptomyces sp. JJ36 TaxID=2736645 RepID=UPI001F1E01A1|nr:class F sortase [Streptomyces sp. JJ36]MCF6524372.1 class F sortase [Streptomyces sp. JJ36]
MHHGSRPHGPGSPGGRFAVGLIAFAFVFGLALIRAGTEEGPGPPVPDAAAARTAEDRTAGGREPAGRRSGPPDGRRDAAPAPDAEPLPAARPQRVRIPAIGVDAPVTPVGLDDRGWLEVPPADRANLAGWYRGAAPPGARGTAVLVGHVDNDRGPAVFYELGALRKGRTVEVVRADGRTAVFTVYGVELHPKDRFPTAHVYRDTRRAELRVITCGGRYTAEGGYGANVVAFARLTAVR